MSNAKTFAVASHLTWLTSSYSGAEGGQCVEIAASTEVVHVRDSKAVAGPVVRVSREAWAGFVGAASVERSS
ncbi:DUF397 domain-containing protein [Streptomyces sp. CWNU-52B]|uniref:DUF397 domain-containing protein n=1 Tax=unclassified Streptomyces TaxID=2593676 RepID=UPI0039C469B7